MRAVSLDAGPPSIALYVDRLKFELRRLRVGELRDGGLRRESPAWSPDGRKIAFVVEKGVQRIGIDVMNADGSGVRELTRHPEDDSPAWSPDGKEIAFVRWFEVVLTDGRLAGYSRIYVVNLADLEVRPRPLVIRKCTDSCYDRDPAWSPDGRMIAITREGRPRYLGSGLVIERSWIYVLLADGTRGRRLTHGPSQDPAWSPDGRMIAFEGKGPDDPGGPTHAGISIMNADGTGVRRLTSWGFDPAWSPDGRKIAFTRAADIDVINVDGSGERVLEADGGMQPAWAPGD